VLGLAVGALSYLLFQTAPRQKPQQPAPQQQAPPSALQRNAEVAQAAPRVTPPPVPEQAAPVVPNPPDSAGIHALLDQWSTALKRGDNRAAAACYAPLVSIYFGRQNVPREAVRQSIIQRSLAPYGRLDIFRISGLAITPAGNGRAEVVFLKHWQTSGYRKFSGEERERMTLARNQGIWQIVAEQQEKPYETRKPR
jgi:hypothetical protein